ncbi:MAG: hypothetical protein COA96_17130 [SAR86 cluster bacterium]|uniref:Anti-sigma-28 factor FlgM C-terminal domain-containing protein n=1 Tax=SAR86 cluster bacterium TaxID=2030880 RepID=A0A2A5AFJ1_9GAMM|nr:MAG: hypothetical protein COA96_17130 [SAR86 cluster bacterium]
MKKPAPNSNHTLIGKNRSDSSVVTRFSVERISRKASTDLSAELAKIAIDVNELEAAIQELPVVDTARLVDIHNRIESNEYSINSDSIAAKLLSIETALDPY